MPLGDDDSDTPLLLLNPPILLPGEEGEMDSIIPSIIMLSLSEEVPFVPPPPSPCIIDMLLPLFKPMIGGPMIGLSRADAVNAFFFLPVTWSLIFARRRGDLVSLSNTKLCDGLRIGAARWVSFLFCDVRDLRLAR